MTRLVALAAIATLLAALPNPPLILPAAAQTSGPAGEKAKSQVCMVKKTKGRQGGDKQIMIIASKASSSSMKARGFRQVSCKGNAAQRSDYKKEMCKFAAIAPANVQADFKRTHGASPSELCEAVQ